MRNDDGIRDMGFGTSGAAGPALKKDYSEIETVVRYYMSSYIWTTYKDRKFNQRFCLTDPDFLDVFDFELVIGDRATVLKEPLSILVTEATARRFFGNDDPIGCTNFCVEWVADNGNRDNDCEHSGHARSLDRSGNSLAV